ncbi:hypothetical protein [Duganella vulcania]|uniref:Uncharacterized protein n=1 Tax=Duganella vulcania TaxID=2692166 RepID=A0A845GEG0_9BURK|nr:hypothetical protein [Duganella vulcania]MYM92684.1 hypothetical protein [Duganella vulcania]
MIGNHVDMWVDRLGNMVFISDEMDNATMAPAYYLAALADHDRSGTEAALWWM